MLLYTRARILGLRTDRMMQKFHFCICLPSLFGRHEQADTVFGRRTITFGNGIVQKIYCQENVTYLSIFKSFQLYKQVAFIKLVSCLRLNRKDHPFELVYSEVPDCNERREETFHFLFKYSGLAYDETLFKV